MQKRIFLQAIEGLTTVNLENV